MVSLLDYLGLTGDDNVLAPLTYPVLGTDDLLEDALGGLFDGLNDALSDVPFLSEVIDEDILDGDFGLIEELFGTDGLLVGEDGFLIGEDGLVLGDEGLLDALNGPGALDGALDPLLDPIDEALLPLIGEEGALIGEEGLLIGEEGLIIGDAGLLDGLLSPQGLTAPDFSGLDDLLNNLNAVVDAANSPEALGRLFGQEGALIGPDGALIGQNGALIGEEGLLFGDTGLFDGLFNDDLIPNDDALGNIFSNDELLGALFGENGALIGNDGALIGENGILIGQEGLLVGDEGLLDGLFDDNGLNNGVIDLNDLVDYLAGDNGLLIGDDGLLDGLLNDGDLTDLGNLLDGLIGDGDELLGGGDGIIGGIIDGDNGILDDYLGDDDLNNEEDVYFLEETDDLLFGAQDEDADLGPIFTGRADFRDFNTMDPADFAPGSQSTHAGDGNDWVRLSDVNNEFYTAGEIFFAESGDDFVQGGIQDDFIHGGRGHDEIVGDAGNDSLFGGTGDDLIKGEDGADVIYGDEHPLIQTETATQFLVTPESIPLGVTVVSRNGAVTGTQEGFGVSGATDDDPASDPSAMGYNPDTHESEALIFHFNEEVTQANIQINGLNGFENGEGNERGMYILFDENGEQIGDAVIFSGESLRDTNGMLTIVSNGFYSIEIKAIQYEVPEGLLDPIVDPILAALDESYPGLDATSDDITTALEELYAGVDHGQATNNTLVSALNELLGGGLDGLFSFLDNLIDSADDGVDLTENEVTVMLDNLTDALDGTVEFTDEIIDALGEAIGLFEQDYESSSDFYVGSVHYTVKDREDEDDGEDLIFAGRGNDHVFGQGGDDEIHGDEGDDHLYGGEGNDEIFGGWGTDTIFGGQGHDNIFGDLSPFRSAETGSDVIAVGSVPEHVRIKAHLADVSEGENGFGVAGATSRNGNSNAIGYDPVTGRSESLTFDLGRNVTHMEVTLADFVGSAEGNERGSYKLFDGLGNVIVDSVVFTAEEVAANGGKLIITSETGFAAIEFRALPYENDVNGSQSDVSDGQAANSSEYFIQSISMTWDNSLFDLGTGNDVIHGDDGDDFIDGGKGEDLLFGDDGDDIIFGGDGRDVIRGGDGSDQVQGGNGNDIIYGGDGGDTYLAGDAGADEIWGGDGSDGIDGGDGSDLIMGGDGDDFWLFGGGGNDIINAGDGDDFADGGNGHDRILGDDGNDVLFGGNGSDELHGEQGNDALEGGNGSDLLFGGVGNDYWLFGGAGDDTIFGGNGDDVLFGGRGNDQLFGDDGADRFLFGFGEKRDGQDVIHDFESGIDVIDLVAYTSVTSFEDLQFALTKMADGQTMLNLSLIGGAEGDQVLINHSGSDITSDDFFYYDPDAAA